VSDPLSAQSERVCEHCGDTGSVRVHSHEDYGVSFECEYCEHCDLGRGLIAAERVAYEQEAQ
jgi:hypothetical protein